MPIPNNEKIINKFIPKTDSHSKSRISKIIQHIHKTNYILNIQLVIIFILN